MRHELHGQFVIYSRKSRFTGKGESIENQIELCRQYLRLHFGAEAAEGAWVFEDEGFSGKSLERPQFQRMMNEAKLGGVRAIVVYRLDRISRNIGDFAGLIERLNGLGIDFISIKEQFDTASPMGRAMMYISSVFSQLERETIAERIRDNMRELSKTGRWLGGVTPTGYASESVSRVSLDGKQKKVCKLRVIPQEAALVRLIFETFLETGSLTQTEALLLRQGQRTKNGKSFSRFAIRGILTNPVYLIADEAAFAYLTDCGVELFAHPENFDGVRGVMAYNRSLQQAGKANEMRPMEDWIVSVGEHPGLIPGRDWVRVQEILEQNRSKSYRRPRGNLALLSGLLVCGNCGSFMRPKQSGRLNEAGEPLFSYLCTLKERSRGHCCRMTNPGGNQLDDAVLKALGGLSEDPALFRRELENNRKFLRQDRSNQEELRHSLEAGVAEREGEIRGLIKALGRAGDSASEDYILREIEALHESTAALRDCIARQEASPPRELTESECGDFVRYWACFSKALAGLGLEGKRAAVKSLVRELVWDGESLHLVLTGTNFQYAYPETK